MFWPEHQAGDTLKVFLKYIFEEKEINPQLIEYSMQINNVDSMCFLFLPFACACIWATA